VKQRVSDDAVDMASLRILTLLLALRRSDIKFCNPLACDDIVSYGGTRQSLDRWLGMNKKHDPSLECLPSAVLLTLLHKVGLLYRCWYAGGSVDDPNSMSFEDCFRRPLVTRSSSSSNVR
jgi:hypothetical protein